MSKADQRLSKNDPRRWRVIETRFRSGPPTLYQVTIDGELWSEVEWSPKRRTWCIQDAAGHCLAHCDHIHGDHIDQQTAVALAKGMIKDGRMPTPEEANQQLQDAQASEPASPLGEPMEILEDTRAPDAVPRKPRT